jgi:hypothetical protein
MVAYHAALIGAWNSPDMALRPARSLTYSLFQ